MASAPDGTMVSTAHAKKAGLFRVLEDRVAVNGSPTNIKSSIVDGNFILHCLPPNLPPTYGGLFQTFLELVLNQTSKRVDIVLGTYEKPSIKDNELELRRVEEIIYVITAAEQISLRNLEKALKSRSFKQQLPRLFVKGWADKRHFAGLNDRDLCVGVDTSCVRFRGISGSVEVTPVTCLDCNHPDPDTKICLHATDTDISL